MINYSVDHFREFVWNYIEERGISQTQLAKELEIAQRGLNRFLNGQGGLTLDHAFHIMNYIEYEPENVDIKFSFSEGAWVSEAEINLSDEV